MKKKSFLLSLLAFAMVAFLSVGFTSCHDDDDDAPSQVVIKNGSTYTLTRFRVVFMNSRMEELTDKDFGTLSPGETVTAVIPTSAKEFYMATYLSNTWYFSPNYEVTYKNLTLTNAEVGNWSANSSANRYPKASSAK